MNKKILKKLSGIEKSIPSIIDFPKKGIIFKDLSIILKNPDYLKTVTKALASLIKKYKINAIVGVEARGYWFGIPLAILLDIPFIPIRKAGKLPRETLEASYKLEYGSATIQVHKDDIKPGQNVLIIDDLIATGGTILATIDLIKQAKANAAVVATILDLEFLNGSNKIIESGVAVEKLFSIK